MTGIDQLMHAMNAGQRAAVAATFRLLGESSPPRFVPTMSGDEVWFILPDSSTGNALRDAEQVLTQVLGRKVWITRDGDRYDASSPFPE